MAFRPRRGVGRSTIGRISKKQQTQITGFKEMIANINRITDVARVEILTRAVDQGGRETLKIMEDLAPRAPGAGTRGFHGADRLQNQKLFSKRDSRARSVGIHRDNGRYSTAAHLKFAEFGTIFVPARPFMRPAAREMRVRMVRIVLLHWKRVTRKALKPG